MLKRDRNPHGVPIPTVAVTAEDLPDIAHITKRGEHMSAEFFGFNTTQAKTLDRLMKSDDAGLAALATSD